MDNKCVYDIKSILQELKLIVPEDGNSLDKEQIIKIYNMVANNQKHLDLRK